MSCAKTAEPINKMPFSVRTWVGPMKHVWDGGHIGSTWRIRLNRPCVAVMLPYAKLLWPLVSFPCTPEFITELSCSDGNVCCLMLMLARSAYCVYRISTVRLKTCIWPLPRRHLLSTLGLRMPRRIWLILFAVTQSKRLRSVCKSSRWIFDTHVAVSFSVIVCWCVMFKCYA